jgi:hypothetical protein
MLVILSSRVIARQEMAGKRFDQNPCASWSGGGSTLYKYIYKSSRGGSYALDPFIWLTACALLALLFLALGLTCLSLLRPVSSLTAPVFLS